MSKFDKPSVVTFADYEVILPPNPLLKLVSQTTEDDSDNDPVGQAQQALANLASEFPGWMDAECERLDRARSKLKEAGFNKATHQALFHAAHDIKGEASTFGYPAVFGAANSLCRLLEHSPEIARIPLSLVDQHVDAVRAIIRENARPDIEDMAVAINAKLRDVTEDFLRQENHHRPDYLDSISAPPAPRN